MAKTIYKYTIDVENLDPIKTAKIYKILHVAENPKSREHGPNLGRYIDVWALVDPTLNQTTDFNVHGTGHPIAPGGVYCGTVVMSNIGLVWHVFIPYDNLDGLPYMEAVR